MLIFSMFGQLLENKDVVLESNNEALTIVLKQSDKHAGIIAIILNRHCNHGYVTNTYSEQSMYQVS